MFQVLNLKQSRFDCTFGRGCPGVCCRNGRPPVYPEERTKISENLGKFLPRMRPEARQMVESEGFLTRRRKAGAPTLRVTAGWCVFFNDGCVLHAAGADEGDKYRYKPALCSIFPLEKSKNGEWYVRQKGFRGEIWDLPCLDPAADAPPAAESLREELALAASFEQDE